MPEISVIVPVYNVENYLHRCVDSILAQTFTDFELILVDDGSPDNCGAICDEYAQKDSRVQVIHKTNGGVSTARNTALNVARGEYIAFCDSDDYWYSDYLEEAQCAFVDNTIDMVVMNYVDVDENNDKTRVTNHQVGIVEYKEEATKFDYILEYLLKGKHGWEIWTRVFRTEIIQKNRIRFCTNCRDYAEDLGFVAEYVLCSQKVNSISESLYCYRKRVGSMMQKSKQCVKLDQVNQVSYQIHNRYMDTISNREYRRRYAVLHFLILYSELRKMIGSDLYCELGQVFDKIRDCNWSRGVLKGLFRCRTYLLGCYGKRISAQILLFTHYCIHGNWKRFRYESAIAYRWFIEKE